MFYNGWTIKEVAELKHKIMLEARTLNTSQMIIRSGKPAISFNRMLSSRCGQSAQSQIRSTTLRFLIFSFLAGQLNH